MRLETLGALATLAAAIVAVEQSACFVGAASTIGLLLSFAMQALGVEVGVEKRYSCAWGPDSKNGQKRQFVRGFSRVEGQKTCKLPRRSPMQLSETHQMGG